MAQCVTCGSELHPERAKKYDYCMAPECQEKNLKGLTMVAVGVNKSAEQYLLLDEETRDGLARASSTTSGETFGTSSSHQPAEAPAPAPAAPWDRGPAAAARRGRVPRPGRPPSRPGAALRAAVAKSQERLALLYNEQGRRPEEIAQKLGLSTYLVSQIILSSRNRGKL